jgi:hypothetical protein
MRGGDGWHAGPGEGFGMSDEQPSTLRRSGEQLIDRVIAFR